MRKHAVHAGGSRGISLRLGEEERRRGAGRTACGGPVREHRDLIPAIVNSERERNGKEEERTLQAPAPPMSIAPCDMSIEEWSIADRRSRRAKPKTKRRTRREGGEEKLYRAVEAACAWGEVSQALSAHIAIPGRRTVRARKPPSPQSDPNERSEVKKANPRSSVRTRSTHALAKSSEIPRSGWVGLCAGGRR